MFINGANQINWKREMNRRRMLQSLAYGAAGMLGLSAAEQLFAEEKTPVQGKAKAVIQIWLGGGPPHLDTFDPKPKAGRDYCGPLSAPIATNVDGIQISQLLPLLAKNADKYSLLRGMTHGNNNHEVAAYMVLAGRKPAEGITCPGVGSVVSLKKGYAAGYKGMIPPYITLTGSLGRFSEEGFLGASYKPFATGGDPNAKVFAVEGIVAENINEERQKIRRDLLKRVDSMGESFSEHPLIKTFDDCQNQAYDMILGDAGKAFLLDQETEETRNRYGRNKFGQSCLLARRLVERGVLFITINHGGWDTHKQHFEAMYKKLPELDKGISALLEELTERGLLDTTIVWCTGEFSRTPKVDWAEPWNGGRGHYGKAFSALVAGGGFRGGTVVGATDDKGETVTQRPIYPWDLTSSIYSLLNIDYTSKLPHPQGKSIAISPLAEEGKIDSGGILKEIM